MKTLVNKVNPEIRITAPEIEICTRNCTGYYYVDSVGYCLRDQWALVEEEPKKITKYLRFGDIPENGKSKIWRGEECIGEEEGISVYEIKFDKDKHISICLPFPFHRDTLDTLCALTKYDNRPCYVVTGEYIGKGTDGEPLISNVQIEEEFPKIISDEKMEQMGEEISKSAVDNIREQFNKTVEEEQTEDWREKRKKECPFRRNLDNNLYGCERYADVVCACDGKCSWVVDYPKFKEIQDRKKQEMKTEEKKVTMKYIDAELLKTELKRRIEERKIMELKFGTYFSTPYMYENILAFIDSLQQEQMEIPSNNTTKDDTLGSPDYERGFKHGRDYQTCVERKYTNKEKVIAYLIDKGYPVSTNGEIPTYQETFDTVKNAIEYSNKQEQPEVDLEKFTEKIKTFQGKYKHPEIVSIKGAMAFMARMFYQYPNVARQWYEQLPKATMD